MERARLSAPPKNRTRIRQKHTWNAPRLPCTAPSAVARVTNERARGPSARPTPGARAREEGAPKPPGSGHRQDPRPRLGPPRGAVTSRPLFPPPRPPPRRPGPHAERGAGGEGKERAAPLPAPSRRAARPLRRRSALPPVPPPAPRGTKGAARPGPAPARRLARGDRERGGPAPPFLAAPHLPAPAVRRLRGAQVVPPGPDLAAAAGSSSRSSAAARGHAGTRPLGCPPPRRAAPPAPRCHRPPPARHAPRGLEGAGAPRGLPLPSAPLGKAPLRRPSSARARAPPLLSRARAPPSAPLPRALCPLLPRALGAGRPRPACPPARGRAAAPRPHPPPGSGSGSDQPQGAFSSTGRAAASSGRDGPACTAGRRGAGLRGKPRRDRGARELLTRRAGRAIKAGGHGVTGRVGRRAGPGARRVLPRKEKRLFVVNWKSVKYLIVPLYCGSARAALWLYGPFCALVWGSGRSREQGGAGRQDGGRRKDCATILRCTELNTNVHPRVQNVLKIAQNGMVIIGCRS